MTQHGKKRHRSGVPGQRQLRVGEELRHAVSYILLRDECHDPRLDGVSVTVSEVRISPDLKNATVFVMPLAGDNKESLLKILNEIAPKLRKLVGSKVALRYTPKLHFRLDDSFDVATHIDSLLKRPEVARDLNYGVED